MMFTTMMFKRLLLPLFCVYVLTMRLSASTEALPAPVKCEKECKADAPKEETVVSSHSLKIGGVNIAIKQRLGHRY